MGSYNSRSNGETTIHFSDNPHTADEGMTTRVRAFLGRHKPQKKHSKTRFELIRNKSLGASPRSHDRSVFDLIKNVFPKKQQYERAHDEDSVHGVTV
jgi:hypothetical protein